MSHSHLVGRGSRTPMGHNREMTVRADRWLALLAMAKLAGLGALIGLVVAVGMTLDGESPWFILAAPLGMGIIGGATLGSLVALSWWLVPGRVTYAVADGLLTARHGNGVRKQVPVERIAEIEFDRQIKWTDLVLSGWFSYVSPIPAIWVTLTPTKDRWDPSNSATVGFPSILIAGKRQRQALSQLRLALGRPPDS
jgi:hypothetical protein